MSAVGSDTRDCLYDFRPVTSPCNDLTHANQLTSHLVPNSQQQSPAETSTFFNSGSRDPDDSAPTVSLPSAAWVYPSLSYARDGLGEFGGTWMPNLTTIATSFTTPPDFQSWAGEQFSGIEDWDSTLNSWFLPSDMNPARPFNPILQNHIRPLFGEVSVQILSKLPAQPEGTEILPAVHGIPQSRQGIYCQQCDSQFSTRAFLETHAREVQHAPYRCRCGATFSRLDVLRRHIQTFQPDISYPCPHCKKHRGSRAFVRLDHLTQHLRGYHNMESGDESDDASPQQSLRKRKMTFQCPHQTCSSSGRIMGMSSQPGQQDPGAMSRIFQTRGEFTKHLREVHDESLFPCVENGCCRVGGKGFFRNKDLLKHVKDHHSNAEFQSSPI